MPNTPFESLPKDIFFKHIAPWLEAKSLGRLRQTSKSCHAFFSMPYHAATLVHILTKHNITEFSGDKFSTDSFFQFVSYKNSQDKEEVTCPIKLAFKFGNIVALKFILEKIKDNKTYLKIFDDYFSAFTSDINLAIEVIDILNKYNDGKFDSSFTAFSECKNKFAHLQLIDLNVIGKHFPARQLIDEEKQIWYMIFESDVSFYSWEISRILALKEQLGISENKQINFETTQMSQSEEHEDQCENKRSYGK